MAEPVAVTETTIRGFKKAIQDFVAPEIRDLKGEVGKINIRMDGLNTTINTRIDGLESKLNTRIDGLENRFDSLEKLVATQYTGFREQLDSQNRSVLAALGEIKALIGESQALIKLDTLQKVSALSERVAVLEASRQ